MTSLTTRASARPPPIYITAVDHQRLSGLVGSSITVSPGAALLRDELDRATIVGAGASARRFARIDSAVTYEDCATGKVRTVQLVLPDAADIDANRVSVLTPVGAALLGLKVGQTFAWGEKDGRPRTLRILDVEHAREAA